MSKRTAAASPVKAALAAGLTVAKKAKACLFSGDKTSGIVTSAELLAVPTDVLRSTLKGLHQQRYLGKLKFVEADGCIIYQNKPGEKYAKLKVSIPKCGKMKQGIRNVEARPHQMSAALNFQDTHSQEEVDAAVKHFEQLSNDSQSKEYTASHLCHDERCSAEGHVIFEPQLPNQRRQNCQLTAVCDHCGTHKVICVHEPKCLKKAKWLRE